MKAKTLFKTLFLIPLFLFQTAVHASEPMSLDEFVREASQKNLGLKAQSAQAAAADANATGLAVPAPMAGMTQTKDASGQANGFEVSQTIPFPTKLTSNHSARAFEAKSQDATRKAWEKEVSAKAKLLYFKLWEAQNRIQLLQEKKSAIAEHIKLATASARSDSFQKVHLLKSESDLDLLENEILQADQDKRERSLEVAVFLNRDPNSFDVLVQEIPLSQVPTEELTAKPFQIEAKRFGLESLKERESEARSAWLPDFNLRYREMGGTSMSPRYSEVMVGATLPFLFFWEPNSESQKASSDRLRAEYQFEQEKRNLDAERISLFSKASTLKKQYELIRDKLLPRAEKRMHLIHNLAPRDMETLIDHREALESLPDLKLKALDVRGQYEQVVADLEKLSSEDRK